MRFSAFSLFSSLLLAQQQYADAASGLKVNQYDGPTSCSEKTEMGMFVKIQFNGKFDESSETGEKGASFYSTKDGSPPSFHWQIGIGQAIPAWDEGLLGLCPGAKVTMVVPPEKGYDSETKEGEGQGRDAKFGKEVPDGATLNFDIEIVRIEYDPNLFTEIDTNGDYRLDREEVEDYMAIKVPDERWQNEDKNGDGFIQWDEFSGPKGKPNTQENIISEEL